MDVEYGKRLLCVTVINKYNKTQELTKILYATDGYVSGLMSSDPLLSKYYAILIDEVHILEVYQLIYY